ncbi:MAG: hypothetical protein R3F14_02665 [Polyangiaceae bacterium]
MKNIQSYLGRRVALVLAILTASAHFGAPALADGTADEADLQFRLGKEEFKKANYDAALAHFFASNRLAPNRNVLFNIASTYEASSATPTRTAITSTPSEGETDERKKADVTAALKDLSPRWQSSRSSPDPPGATLYIGRRDLGSVGRAPRPSRSPPANTRSSPISKATRLPPPPRSRSCRARHARSASHSPASSARSTST